MPRTLWRRQPRRCWRWWLCPWSPWSCSVPPTCQTCEGWLLRLPGGGQRYGWKCTTLRRLQWSASIRVKVDGKINKWYLVLIRETHSPKKFAKPPAHEKWREEWYAPIFSSQHWSKKKVLFHHSNKPTRLQRKLQIGCLPRWTFAWVPRQVHKLAFF